MLEAVCPNGHRLQVPLEHAGLKLRCPACNAVFQLVGPRGEVAPSSIGASAAPAAAGATSPATQVAAPTAGAAGESTPAMSPTVNPAAATTQAPAVSVNPGTSPTTVPTTASEVGGGRWSGTDPMPPSNGPALSTSASSSRVMPPGNLPTPRRDWQTQIQLWIKPVLALGLVLVLTARGCDSLAQKDVARLDGALKLSQREFAEQTESAVSALQTQLSDPKIIAAKRTELQKQLDDLQAAHVKQRNELQNSTWRELTYAGERAIIEARAGGYRRELLFVAGTILFALGLLTTALLGDGAERWLCFGLLGIIVFSIYIGGTAWTASFLSDFR